MEIILRFNLPILDNFSHFPKLEIFDETIFVHFGPFFYQLYENRFDMFRCPSEQKLHHAQWVAARLEALW